MALFEWNERYSVQVDSIDEQHRELVNMISALHEAMSKGKSKVVMAPLLEELTRYTKEHFSFEESLMRRAGYPGLEAHRLTHCALVDKVVAFQEAYAQDKVGLSLEIMELQTIWVVLYQAILVWGFLLRVLNV